MACNLCFWFSKNVVIGACNFLPTPGILPTISSTLAISVSLKATTTNNTCMLILMAALPKRVAPKKVQNGIKKCPHVIPARSNNGFGI